MSWFYLRNRFFIDAASQQDRVVIYLFFQIFTNGHEKTIRIFAF